MVSTKKSGEELAKQKKKSAKQTIPSTKRRLTTRSKSNEGRQKGGKKASNGITRTKPKPKHKPDVVPASSSSAESVEEDEDVEETREADSRKSKVTENRKGKTLNVKKSEKSRKGIAVDDDNGDGEERTSCRFPLARVKRIMKNHGSDLMLSHDAVFVVNKAVVRAVSVSISVLNFVLIMLLGFC